MAGNFSTPLEVIDAIRKVMESVQGRYVGTVPQGKDVVDWINEIMFELKCTLRDLPREFADLRNKASSSRTTIYPLEGTFELMLGYAETAWGRDRAVVTGKRG